MTRSPSHEADMVISGSEFCFGGEYVKPLMEICFSSDSSGKDLTQFKASVTLNMNKDIKDRSVFTLSQQFHQRRQV